MNIRRILLASVLSVSVSSVALAQRHGSGAGHSGGGSHFGGGSRLGGGTHFGGSHFGSGGLGFGGRSFSHGSSGFGGSSSRSMGSFGGATRSLSGSGFGNRSESSNRAFAFNGSGNRFGNGFNGSRGSLHHFGGRGSGPWGDRFRDGFWHRRGFEGSFFFGFYLDSPLIEPCVISPWYWYPCVPGYIPEGNVIIEDQLPVNWDAGEDYDYQPTAEPLSYGNHELNCAVGQIRNVFSQQLDSAVDYLVPDGDTVAVYNEDKYMYSLSGHDFRALMKDNMKATKTESFDVTYVHTDGDEAIVKCRHTFEDPQSGEDTIYQMYRLRRDGDRYHITDFKTSSNEIHEDYF